jgi:hypothetical protein
MFYAANIPLLAASLPADLQAERVSKFSGGLQHHLRGHRRPHFLLSSYEYTSLIPPFIMPPLQNSYFDVYHPEKGIVTHEKDRIAIRTMVQSLQKYMKPSQKVYIGGYNEQGESEGYGKHIDINGDIYDGNWVAGQPHGYGTMSFTSGNRYEGE